ncbi:MAG: sigma-70 family RNA polymerase sigma factor [Clostridia bacterium]|nr:sigma-70 family RNA polymerase sigma factor [Clostridia bacterium]
MLSVSSGQNFPPPITAAEEKELFRKFRTEGDEKARTRLIEHNLRLVAHIVRKYYTAQTGQEDLISIGTVGLIKAIDSFNDRNGARFATYAAKCIQNAIHFSGTTPVLCRPEQTFRRAGSPGVFCPCSASESDACGRATKNRSDR